MTGTGTQADPFIVDNWDDFVTAVGTQDAYVAFPEGGGTINMNNVAPNGLSASVTVRCKYINGNNWTILGIYCVAKDVFFSKTSITIDDLYFINTYLDFQREQYAYFWHDDEGYRLAIFNRCIFTGVTGGISSSYGEAARRGVFYTAYYYSEVQLNSCSVNFQLGLWSTIYYIGGSWQDPTHMSNCNIQIQTTNSEDIKGDYRNCLLSGVSNSTFLDLRYNDKSNYNVVNIDFRGSESFACQGPSGSVNLINTDLLPSGATIGVGFIGVTTAQLKDAQYLASIGFPIGVD